MSLLMVVGLAGGTAGAEQADNAAPAASDESPTARVAWLARRLLVANAAECHRQRWDFGLVANRTRLPAAPALLPSQAAAAEPDGFRVIQLVPGSPAARAGLRPGDRVLAVNGQDWTSTGFALAFARAEWGQAGAERIELRFERAGVTQSAQIIGERACAIPVRLVQELKINASAAAGVAFINSGLEQALPQDDQMATVISHELAHVILGHRKLGAGSNDRAQMERDADTLGVRLAMRAGFDPQAAARAIEVVGARLGNRDSRLLGLDGDHMPTPARRRFLQEQAMELRREQLAAEAGGGLAAGQP